MDIPTIGAWVMFLLGGCKGTTVPEDSGQSDILSTLLPTLEASSIIPTLERASFQTEEASVARVVWEGGGSAGSTPWEEEEVISHEVAILGLPQWSEIALHVEVMAGDEVQSGPTVSFQTVGALEPVPLVTAEGEGAIGLGGYIAVPFIEDTSPGGDIPLLGLSGGTLGVYDPGGRLVWSYRVEGFGPYAIRPAEDGSGLWYLGFDFMGFVSFDGETRKEWNLLGLHHDLVALPHGTAAALTAEIFEVDGHGWLLDGIVEFDADGRVVWSWNAHDHLEELQLDPGEGPDWATASTTHANALSYDPIADKYYINLSGIGVIAEIDRASGAARRFVSPSTAIATAEFVLDSEDPYILAHRFELSENELLLFVNATVADNCSKVVSLDLDEGTGQATERWAYAPENCPSSFLLGTMQRLPGGIMFVDWSTSGLLEEVDEATGERLLGLQSDFGWAFGYGEWIPDLYSAPAR